MVNFLRLASPWGAPREESLFDECFRGRLQEGDSFTPLLKAIATPVGGTPSSTACPEGPARHLDVSQGPNCLPTVSRQFLTRNYPRPNRLLKCLPNCLSPTGEGIFSSFKITPAVRAIARQLRDKNCLGAIFAPGHQDVSQGPLGEKRSGTKKEPKPKLLSPDIFRWGRGRPHEGVGAKKFGTPLETREIKFFWRDIPGFCRDIPGVPEKFEKKKFGFNFRSLEKIARCEISEACRSEKLQNGCSLNFSKCRTEFRSEFFEEFSCFTVLENL